jgi:hypothetical protein
LAGVAAVGEMAVICLSAGVDVEYVAGAEEGAGGGGFVGLLRSCGEAGGDEGEEGDAAHG